MTDISQIIGKLPDPVSAQLFWERLSENHPSAAKKLEKRSVLLTDVLTLVTYSPLIASTLLNNTEYIWWLDRKRGESVVRNKEELLESLARFSLTNSQIDQNILYARFRRRELVRIFLRDIRGLSTIAEITEEISNLADSILEDALRKARQEMDNRFGSPQVADAKGRLKPADFCIVSLGKLGSRELNYSSDIDLLFMYTAEGTTSGVGSRGSVTNKEYFNKLASAIIKLVGSSSGEGAAYRVDMRLRPYGSVGPLTASLAETIRYYKEKAAPWERQVLIRMRASAGDRSMFRRFAKEVEPIVFSASETVDHALANVKRSKQMIDLDKATSKGIDVKLGIGGIREIEFIAQALQLAYGGRDSWLRSPHTLISLRRLADRDLLSDTELTELANAYAFLRKLEHILQMEEGLQTHLVPNDENRRYLVARKMFFENIRDLDDAVASNMSNVNRVFRRVFDDQIAKSSLMEKPALETPDIELPSESFTLDTANANDLDRASTISQRISTLIGFQPFLADQFETYAAAFDHQNINAEQMAETLSNSFAKETTFSGRLCGLRQSWSGIMLQIAVLDALQHIDIKTSKRLQTYLAEASITSALKIVDLELKDKSVTDIDLSRIAVMGLGKLGGAGVDYDSDLDLVMAYDPDGGSAESFSRAVGIFINVLSAMTRDGSLYRVDLRLRPYGSDGTNAVSIPAFTDYMQTKAAIWEMLAFVKLRGVGGNIELARSVEWDIRCIIHQRALAIPTNELAAETLRVRTSLEKSKTRSRRSTDIDIKYGPGGMLDIYFAIRYLQLRDNVPDDDINRSSGAMLQRLHKVGSLSDADLESMLEGYVFLSRLDHWLRLTTARASKLPLANVRALSITAERMEISSQKDLIDQLNIHRLAIRTSFENIL